MRVLDLFSGIGGFSLGLERAGMKTVGFCEIEPYCSAVLRKHWPDVWIHDDIRTLTPELVMENCGAIDCIAAGVPCQPASTAGTRKGIKDSRWRWPDFLRVVREIQPMWVLAEQPTGIVSLEPVGLDWIIDQLESLGYEVGPLVIGCHNIGSPQIRQRVFLVARLVAQPGRIRPETRSIPNRVPTGERQQIPTGPRGPMSFAWPPRPSAVSQIPVMADGLCARLVGRAAGISATGDTISPQIAAIIGRAIMQIEEQQ